MYSFCLIDFLEHLNDKLSQVPQPLLRVKGNLVLVSLVEQHPTHSCPEQMNPAPGPWPKEAVGPRPRPLPWSPVTATVCRGLAKHALVSGRTEQSRAVSVSGSGTILGTERPADQDGSDATA